MKALKKSVTALDEATAKAGGVTALANAINQNQSTVSMWRKRGSVPTQQCTAIERVTGISRCRLRPDDWHLIWPELATDSDMPASESTSVHV